MGIKKAKLIVLLMLMFALSSCVSVGKKEAPQRPDGGLYISKDKGETWQHQVAISNAIGQKQNFAFSGVNLLKIDPADKKAVYFGSIGDGLLYSYDQTRSWQIAKSLGRDTIGALAIDPESNCTIYASIGKKLFKSNDCNRSWENIYTESAANLSIVSVVVDHFDTSIVYLALSRGDLLKSLDKGVSWQTIYRFGKKIDKLYMDPSDSRRMYMRVNDKGLYMSSDAGNNWESIKSSYQDYKIGKNIIDLVLLKEEPNMIYMASRKAILKSDNRGSTWEQISLLPPDAKALIRSIVVNPKNLDEIYYITGTTFYKSIDGGKNWTPRPNPSKTKAKLLRLNEENPDILYMGFAAPGK